MDLKRVLEIPKKRLIKKILGFDEIFTIAIRNKDCHSVSNDNKTLFLPISYSKKYWYADPLVYSYQDNDYLFAEAFDRKKGKGHISVALIGDNIKNLDFTNVIEEKYHMSFPMVFDWHNKIFMIPETSENHSINLYVSNNFPYKWELFFSYKSEIMYVDTVLIDKTDTKLYFLTSEVSVENPLMVRFQKFSITETDTSLNLIWDDEFNNTQQFNLKDRNAGNIIIHNGHKILPTQTSSKVDYGIEVLLRDCDDNKKTIKGFTKNNVAVVGIKSDNIIGIHTYSCTKDFDIIDLRYLKFAPLQNISKLIRK